MSEDKKIETTKVATPEVAAEEQERTPAVNQQILSGQDAYIGSIVQRQPSKISARAVSREYVDITELPAECVEHKNKYAFRWVGKGERQITKATEVEGWTICTRQNAPFIPSSFFKIHGAVEKNGLLLAFMLREQAEAKKEKNRNKHESRKKMLRGLSKRPHHYAATLSEGEVERDAHQQGRDF